METQTDGQTDVTFEIVVLIFLNLSIASSRLELTIQLLFNAFISKHEKNGWAFTNIRFIQHKYVASFTSSQLKKLKKSTFYNVEKFADIVYVHVSITELCSGSFSFGLVCFLLLYCRICMIYGNVKPKRC